MPSQTKGVIKWQVGEVHRVCYVRNAQLGQNGKKKKPEDLSARAGPKL